MKPEEAREFLQERIDLINQGWSDMADLVKYRAALEIAVKAVRKQIPMKPNNMKTIFDFSGKYYTTKGDCPVCNKERLYKSDFYCNKCGQKLDWGGSEKP